MTHKEIIQQRVLPVIFRLKDAHIFEGDFAEEYINLRRKEAKLAGETVEGLKVGQKRITRPLRKMMIIRWLKKNRGILPVHVKHIAESQTMSPVRTRELIEEMHADGSVRLIRLGRFYIVTLPD